MIPSGFRKLNERLDGLAEVYDMDNHSIMRFHHYNPLNAPKQFQKFAEEVIPYQARDGFAWKEHQMFITQDEIDAYLAGGGAYSEGRLSIYSFYLLHQDEEERTGFIKEQYGIGESAVMHCLEPIIPMQIITEKDYILQEVLMVNTIYVNIIILAVSLKTE